MGGGHIQVLQGVHHCSTHIGVGRMRVLYDPSEGCGGFGAVHGMGCGAPFVPQSSVEWSSVELCADLWSSVQTCDPGALLPRDFTHTHTHTH